MRTFGGRAGTGPTGRDLVDACERLLAAHGPVALPTEDLVHGDVRHGNILFDADRVGGVIDIEALGSGTRVRLRDAAERARLHSRGSGDAA
ncbi:phosphotransferase [Streptomyces sp. NPDC059262]|uniref:phosphotransferase n=1 Tax=Streptomyces sp. NPDC059262 TaxID=3346797 RepID=UPI0036BC3324